VVDDDEIVRATARSTLRRYGYAVIEVRTGREAIEHLRERKAEIALVLLDLTMPAMSGAETFAKLRQIDPDLPVILSSGLSEAEAGHRFRGHGLAGFLQKPYTAAALARKVRAVVRSRQANAGIRPAAPPP
jgi:CheY-like chemotaxis protein